ncbi:MAG: tetratricopeptide repeat protein [Pyrinomonadaceae bacterium]
MSFDKEKVRRTADKNLSQGKIQPAIRDYCQIVENDPKDYNTLNMLGDLYARVDAKDEAIACFKRIADHYNSQGFAHKAIAMYKKMLRLLPGSVEIAAKLAPLYQMLGLTSEARSFYLLVAEEHQKTGAQLKALEIWSRIADLDPNDTVTRLKLAENFLKEEEYDKAVEAYAEAGNRLLAKKQTEEAAVIFAKALELSPFDLTVLNGATSASIALGLPDEAAERLVEASAINPDSPEILSMLAHAYVEGENVLEAENTIARLIDREPSSYKRYLDVVRLYLKENKVADATRVISFCGEMLISSNQEEELLHWLNEILARDPEQLVALRLLTRVRAWQRNEDELKTALERLAESAQLNGAEGEERDALTELATLFPEDERYANRLRELGVEFEPNRSSNGGQQNDALEYVPTFESFNTLSQEGEHVTEYDQPKGPDLKDDSVWENAPSDLSKVYSDSSFDAGNNNYELETETSQNLESASNGHDTFPTDDVQFAVNANTDALLPDSTVDFSFDMADDHQVVQNQASEPVPARPNTLTQLKEDLESVDFYISQNYRDLALDTLDTLETQYGPQPLIAARRDALNGIKSSNGNGHSNGNAPHAETVEMPAAAAEVKPQVKSDESIVASSGFEDLFAELGDDLQVAALPAMQTADYETHYNLGLAYKEMDLMDDAVEEFQNAVKMVAPSDGTARYLQCCNLIGHCFMEKGMPTLAILWYQRGLDTPGHTEDEYQALRYELGLAYEQAGDADKALEQFSGIYAVNVTYRNIGDKVRSLQTA